MLQIRKTTALSAVLFGLLAIPAAASADTLYVSHTATPNARDGSCATAAFSTVQSAVNAADGHAQVYLCGATPYLESVAIQDKQIDLSGDPGATIKAPANAAVPGTYFSSQGLQTPNSVLTILGDANVGVEGLTIEGPFVNVGCGGDDFGVLALGGARVRLEHDSVLNIGAADQPGLGGCQYGVGIQIGREYWPNTSGGFDVKNFVGQAQIRNTTVSGYQKNGITGDGPGSGAQIQGSTVDGGGKNPIIARNGIQISRGATGDVRENSINNNEYIGAGPFASATGVLVFGGCGDPLSTHVRVHGNTLTNNDSGVVLADYTADPSCVASATTPTNNDASDNVVAKNDGITNHSPFTDENNTPYTGYQVGVADTGNSDRVQDNQISSTDGAFGPSVTPGGVFLAPIDIQTYPPIDSHVHGNTYNGSPTQPPY
jgi:hypothetical protein